MQVGSVFVRVLSWRGTPALFSLLVAGVMTYFARARAGQPLYGDEWRYLWYAENLLKGYYSPPDYVFLWSGPGYSVFLMPFVKLGASADLMRSVNGAIFGAAVFCFLGFARRVAPLVLAYLGTLGLCLYLPMLGLAPLIYTETFTVFLIAAWLWAVSAYLERGGRLLLALSGALFGWFVMTKLGYWPMLYGGLAVFGGLALWKKGIASRRLSASLAVAVLTTLPYLAHTQYATGRFFYWGSGTGSMLYWITNPYPGHYGEYFHQGRVQQIASLRRHHWPFVKSLGQFDRKVPDGYTGGERAARSMAALCSPESDDRFREVALRNLRAHPKAYLKNLRYNVSRLFFDFPFTVRPFGPESKRFAATNPLLFVGSLWAMARLRKGNATLPVLAWFLAWTIASSLLILALLTTEGRYFAPTAPLGLALMLLVFARKQAEAATPATEAPPATPVPEAPGNG